MNDQNESNLKIKKKDKIIDLERRIKLQGQYITTLNWVLGVLSLLLTVSTIGVPIFQYVTVIQPSKELIDNLEKRVNERIEHAIKENRQAEVDSAYSWIMNKHVDENRASRAMSFFSTYTASVLTEQQIAQFLAAIDLKNNFSHASMLESVYATKASRPVMDFSREQLRQKGIFASQSAIYLIKYEDYNDPTMNLLKRYVKIEKTGTLNIDFYTTCIHAAMTKFKNGDTDWLIALLNSNDIVDEIQLGNAKDYKSNYKVTIDNFVEETGDEALKNTYCYKVVSH